MSDQSQPPISHKEAYRRMLALALPEWRTLLAATVFLALGSTATLIFPKIAGDMVTRTVKNGALNETVGFLFAVFLVQAVASSLRYYLFTLAGTRIVANLRSRTYARIMSQEIGFFDHRKTGELISRLSNDTSVLQNTVSVNISMMLRSMAISVGGVVMMILGSPRLAMVMLAVVPPVSLGAVWFGRRISKLSRKVQDALARAGEVAEETISGVRTVRAFAAEGRENARYKAAVDDSLAAVRTQINYTAWFSGVITFSGYGVIGLVLWYGGNLVLSGAIELDILIQFILYTLMVAFSLGTLAGLWADFMRAVGAADRVFQIMDRAPAILHNQGLKPEHLVGQLSLENVSFSYPTRPDIVALHEVSFQMSKGDTVALVGPSGSGKSTIASLIPRFYDPTSGRILLDGIPLTELDPDWLRQQIGMVSQEPDLFSTTIAENIGYGRLDAGRQEIEAAALAANAHQFIETFPEGYETEVGERGVQLSGGQKQRIAIARALLRNPAVLILDEATSALDTESEFLVKQALARLMEGRTTLVIAHRLSTVRDADRVVVLDQGRIVETGNHATLMNEPNGLYRKLVEHQFLSEENLETSRD